MNENGQYHMNLLFIIQILSVCGIQPWLCAPWNIPNCLRNGKSALERRDKIADILQTTFWNFRESKLLYLYPNFNKICSQVQYRIGLGNGLVPEVRQSHYNDIILGAMASQITSIKIAYSTVYSGADQRKHQSSASLAFVRGIHRSLLNSPHKGPVTRKIFPFDDVIIITWTNDGPVYRHIHASCSPSEQRRRLTYSIWLYFAEIPGAWCSMGYPSEVRPKSREISFTHNLCLSYPMVSKFSTEHDSITAVLCVKGRNHWTTFKMNFARIS